MYRACLTPYLHRVATEVVAQEWLNYCLDTSTSKKRPSILSITKSQFSPNMSLAQNGNQEKPWTTSVHLPKTNEMKGENTRTRHRCIFLPYGHQDPPNRNINIVNTPRLHDVYLKTPPTFDLLPCDVSQDSGRHSSEHSSKLTFMYCGFSCAGST